MKSTSRVGKLPLSLKRLRYIGAFLTVLLIGASLVIWKTSLPSPAIPHAQAAQDPASWIQLANGRLIYEHDAQGNQIPDFSAVGYAGGGVPLPHAPTQLKLNPQSTGDDTSRIQQALDQVAKLAPDVQGIRGAVLLTAGTYRIGGTLNINTSGVVLRGEGSGSDGTVLVAQGQTRILVNMGGNGTWKQDGPVHHVTDDYVPVGSRSFNVDNITGLAVGDHVIVQRPTTAKWIHEIGMDQIPPRKDGKPIRQWEPDKGLFFDRIVTGIKDQQITIDVPLTNALEKEFTDAIIWKYTFPERISQTGMENLSSDATAFTNTPDYANGGYFNSLFVNIRAVENGWGG